MKYFEYISFFVLFVSFIFVFSTPAFAQFEDLYKPEINVEMIPKNPGPNEVVYVSLTSYATNINSAAITWKVNGVEKMKGIGEKTFSFTTGDMNTTTTLEISVFTIEGQTVQSVYKLKPVSVDLIWQSSGFVAPFYKGKSLFAHQNKITFVAIPHITAGNGGEISPKNLVYVWKLNGSVKQNLSGYGKDTYTLTGSLISRPIEVEVEVTTPTNESSGYARTVVSPIDPFVVFYEKNPLYGIEFQNALSGIKTLETKEIAVIGIPFFFGTANSHSGLLYKWFINAVPVDSDYSQTTRVFRQNEGVSGTSNISLSVQNANKILQLSSTKFSLMFGENNN